MFDDLSKTIRESIRQDMKGKFGLSDSESEQSSKILSEKFREIFTEENLKENLGQLKDYFQGLGSEAGNLKEKFNRDTINELINKVGLSEDTATRIKDLSFEKYMEQFKTAISDIEGRFDGQKIQDLLSKLKVDNLEDSAREAMDNINKLFKRDTQQK